MLDFIVGLKINKIGIIKKTKLLKEQGDASQISHNSTFIQFPEEPLTIWQQMDSRYNK